MALLADEILDAALQVIRDAATPVLHLCSQAPTTYTEASSTYSLGNKTAPSIGAQADGTPNGRAVSIATFTDGTVTASGTGTHWALVDDDDDRLLVVRQIASSQTVTSGNPLHMTSALVIRIADATDA